MIHRPKLTLIARFLRQFPCWRRSIAGYYLRQRRERKRLFREAVRREKLR